MIFTNTRRVWRYHTRGDYWVLDLKNKKLKQLGRTVKPTTMQFAKFSPDGEQVAYVSEQNIYVESLTTGEIKQITTDGGDNIINGTFDWLYEEELSLRDGYRWSPDGKWIAYWQLNTQGVKTFHLISNTDSLYPKLIPILYPKVGQTTSASRNGVVSSGGGKTRRDTRERFCQFRVSRRPVCLDRAIRGSEAWRAGGGAGLHRAWLHDRRERCDR